MATIATQTNFISVRFFIFIRHYCIALFGAGQGTGIKKKGHPKATHQSLSGFSIELPSVPAYMLIVVF